MSNTLFFKFMTLVLSLFLSPLSHSQQPMIQFGGTQLIYGADDRVEVEDYDDLDFQEKAKSVAVKISKRRLNEEDSPPNSIEFYDRKLNQRIRNLCPTERFFEQSSIGDCTGFLVGPKTLITAGHCVNNSYECTNNRWVFDFKKDTTEFKRENVYSCKRVLDHDQTYTNKKVSDYAVIELDRPVINRSPLKFRRFGKVSSGTPLVVIGHPLGLPMKITDGARVTRMNDLEKTHPWRSIILRENYFTANLDTYSGASGSPVFNKNTGKVEGLIIQGAEDFTTNEKNFCLESRRLGNARLNTYEKVMRITKIPSL